MIQTAAGAIAAGDTERGLRGGGHGIVGGKRHRVHAERGAVVIPREHFFRISQCADDSIDVAAGLGGDVDGQLRNGAKHHRTEKPLLVLEVEIAPPAILLLHRGEVEREPVWAEHAVGLEFDPAAVPRTHRVAHRAAVAVGGGEFGRLIDDAARIADTEQDAVRTAAVVVTADPVGVRRSDAREIIQSLAGRDAAGADIDVEIGGVDVGVLVRAAGACPDVHLRIH